MILSRQGLILCAVLAGLTGSAVAAPPTVIAVRHSATEAGMRLVLETSAAPQFSLFTLTDPARLVLDFPALAWEAGPEADLAARLPMIESLRHGLFRHDRARIVLALSEPLAVAAAYARPGDGAAPARLVLDLTATTPERFAETAGWPEGARWEPEAMPKPPPPGEIVVAIDPGHGGIDPGAIAADLVEKRIVLEFSRRLAERLEGIPGVAVIMTRRDDRFVPLRQRIRLARQAGAHLMLSIHTDKLPESYVDGVALYTLSRRGTDAAADAFARRENRADVLAGADLAGTADDLTRVLIDLARRGTKAESIRLADIMVRSLESRVEMLSNRPHRRGNFFVLKAPDIPSVLIELGFLSSAADRRRVVDPDWQDRAATALTEGVRRWLETAPPGFLRPRD